MKRILTIFILLIYCTLRLLAQDQIEIKAVFEKYAKTDGVVYVQLSHDILSQGSNLSLYKSMLIKKATEEQENEISGALLSNNKEWKALSSVTKNGNIESATYHVGKDKTRKLNTYLLLKNKNKKLTILYIEGSFAPNQLEHELKKLKDLFIYVNNEKVRIQ